MPLLTDENLFRLRQDIVATLEKTLDGEHPGCRAAHARELLLHGSFTPSATAAQLSSAPNFAVGSTTPVTARFSSGTNLPRYTFVPVAGVQHLDADAVKQCGPDFLNIKLQARITDKNTVGPATERANGSDVTNDATARWPAERERERVLLGTVALDRVAKHNGEAQKQIIFDAAPRVECIEPSANPLLDVRAAVYVVSGRRRRAAHQVE